MSKLDDIVTEYEQALWKERSPIWNSPRTELEALRESELMLLEAWKYLSVSEKQLVRRASSFEFAIVFSDELDELRRKASRYDKLIEEFLNDDIASHVIERMHAAVREEMGDDDEDG